MNENESTPAPKTQSMWRSMDTAPTDGTPFVALERWKESGAIYARVYKYEGHPNYWHCKREGVCIRSDYQDRYVWAPLPAEDTPSAKTQPVAWGEVYDDKIVTVSLDKSKWHTTPLYLHPPAAPNPHMEEPHIEIDDGVLIYRTGTVSITVCADNVGIHDVSSGKRAVSVPLNYDAVTDAMVSAARGEMKPFTPPNNDTLRRAISAALALNDPAIKTGLMTIEEYVDGYSWRGDEGDYTPKEHEKAMLIDALHGARGVVDANFVFASRHNDATGECNPIHVEPPAVQKLR